MYEHLTKIDELIRQDHYYIESNDECYYLGEYTARRGYAFSETNQLILNLKKSPLKQGKSEWKYKTRAIDEVARSFVNTIHEQSMKEATFVPIPPSKIKGDPEYDDRIMQVLLSMQKIVEYKLDIRELVIQNQTMIPAHEQPDGYRPAPQSYIDVYSITDKLIDKNPDLLVIVDDVITTGCHYKAMKHVLSSKIPSCKNIVGLFVARRVPDSDDIETISLDDN